MGWLPADEESGEREMSPGGGSGGQLALGASEGRARPWGLPEAQQRLGMIVASLGFWKDP